MKRVNSITSFLDNQLLFFKECKNRDFSHSSKIQQQSRFSTLSFFKPIMQVSQYTDIRYRFMLKR
jgi:hypothetical protein